MAAPTFVAEYESTWNTSITPRVSASFNALAGDVLVVIGMSEDSPNTLGTPTNTQGALTWTLRQSVVVTDYCTNYIWTATVDANKTGMTVSVARTAGGGWFGINVLHFRDSAGIGASAKANASGEPSVGLTTTTQDSAVVVAVSDWNAVNGATRTWRTVGVAATELTYSLQAGAYTVYAARHTNAGAAGAKTAGLSAPTGQKYSITAVEVRGITSDPPGEGTGSVSVAVGLTGAGETVRTGTAAVDLELALTGTGSTVRTGSASVEVTVGLTGAGSTLRQGTGSLDLTVALSGAGSVSRSGTGTTGVTIALTGSGTTARAGTGSTSLTLALTGTGVTPPDGDIPTGTGSVQVTVGLGGTGQTNRSGTADVPLSLALTGIGQVTRTGSGSTTVTVAISQAADEDAGEPIVITATRLWSATATRTLYIVYTERGWEVHGELLQPPP